MKKTNILTLVSMLLFTMVACDNNQTPSSNTSNSLINSETVEISSSPTISEEIKTLAPKVEADSVQLYALKNAPYIMEQVLNPLLQPFWNTREVYNETFMFIGQEGECELLYAPSEILSIKDYRLKQTYIKGVDFEINGNVIKRTANSSMPYLEANEYWVDEETKNANTVENINFEKVIENAPGLKEFNLTGQRYLKVRENILPEFSQCVISYKHNEAYPTDGFYPQSKGIENFINKLENDKKASIVFYGDSITEGWTASGHIWEWAIEPNMSSWVHMVEDYLENKYEAEIDVTNEAIGGWTTSQGLANYDIKMEGSIPHRHSHESEDRAHESLNPDLLVLGFGMNDWTLDPEAYQSLIAKIVAKYYANNPEGNVILISSMPANVDTAIEGNQRYFEENLKVVAHNYEGTLVAPVYSTYQQLFKMGKHSRDILSNNVNHPNDFGVRVYAQVVLKTLLGSNYCDESIKVSE